jgi:hypothetical protein
MNRRALDDLDRHALYEACVQAPARLVPLLVRIHGGAPRVLGEDFCGTAAVARAWLALVPASRARGVDSDPAVLARAAESAGSSVRARLELLRADVRALPDDARADLDVLFTGNFSIGELATRAELVSYLARARTRLAHGGVFVCDLYGGESAFRTGAMERTHVLADGRRVHYVWEQRSADPRDARVVNALHFRLEDRGEIVRELADAFVYRWRLWSLAELNDALVEAGFTRVDVWRDLDAAARAVATADELGASWIVCVSAH